MGFMYANAYIICVRYVVASVDPPPSYYRSTCTPVYSRPAFSTPTMADGHRPPVCAYICSSALIYRICIAVNLHRLPSIRLSLRFSLLLILFQFPWRSNCLQLKTIDSDREKSYLLFYTGKYFLDLLCCQSMQYWQICPCILFCLDNCIFGFYKTSLVYQLFLG